MPRYTAPMNPKLAIALIALALPLAGCGNKGPLVLAAPPEPVEAAATPAGEVPVEIAPETEAEPALEPTPDPAEFDPAEPDPAEPPPDDDADG